ncbi:ABC-2 transporter permease [Gracilibacillus phocaeensis]|uniref:ABC-2 transporter permease n=1 Tax=Gracilibacillus phocaeensis TaxID=2042304 RepID=UPI0013EF034B|nr:ABC-2 transporter permease [Gracilibacillus phocaeensis]
MWGLVLKDMLLLKKYWLKAKYTVTLLLIIILSLIFLKESSMIVAIFITMLLLNSVQILFIDDNKSGWTTFLHATTNLKAEKIVLGRYTVAITIIIFANLLFFSLNLIIDFLYPSLSLKGVMLLGIVVLSISLLYMLVLIPFTYLFEQNGMIYTFLFFIITGFLLSNINNIDSIAAQFMNEKNNFYLISLGIIGLMIVSFVSYIFSVLIYKRRFMNQ